MASVTGGSSGVMMLPLHSNEFNLHASVADALWTVFTPGATSNPVDALMVALWNRKAPSRDSSHYDDFVFRRFSLATANFQRFFGQ